MLNNETVYYIDLRRVVDEFLCLYFLWFESQSYFLTERFPEEATLTIDGLKHTNVTFPYTTKIRRGFDETVVKIEITELYGLPDHYKQKL